MLEILTAKRAKSIFFEDKDNLHSRRCIVSRCGSLPTPRSRRGSRFADRKRSSALMCTHPGVCPNSPGACPHASEWAYSMRLNYFSRLFIVVNGHKSKLPAYRLLPVGGIHLFNSPGVCPHASEWAYSMRLNYFSRLFIVVNGHKSKLPAYRLLPVGRIHLFNINLHFYL